MKRIDKLLIIITIVIILAFFIYMRISTVCPGSTRTGDLLVTYEDQPVKDKEFYAVHLRCAKDAPSYEDINSEISRISKSYLKYTPLLFLNGGYDADRNCHWIVSFRDCRDCWDSKCQINLSTSEFKIGVYLPDENKLFLSNDVIRRKSYYNTYKVNLQENGDIIVKDVTTFYQRIKKLFSPC